MIGDLRSYGRSTGTVLLLGMGVAAWLASPAPDEGSTGVDVPRHGPAMSVRPDSSASCMARSTPPPEAEPSPDETSESRDPRMTKAPDWDETSAEFPLSGDLRFDTTFELNLDLGDESLASRQGSATGAADALEPPELDRPLESYASIEPVLAENGELGSLPNLPESTTSSDSDAEVSEKIDRMARVASKTLNGIDRLGRKVMDGARLSNPTRRNSNDARPEGPQARLAPNWIRGSPGARLEISF